MWVDFSKTDYEYVVAGPVTLRSFIKSDRETVMNFMRGLADGMDFYRDERNKDAVHKYLGEFYKSNNIEELEETRRVYSQVTPGLPIVTAKAMDNMIASDRIMATMNINGADVMDLSFLKQLEEERKSQEMIVQTVQALRSVPAVQIVFRSSERFERFERLERFETGRS